MPQSIDLPKQLSYAFLAIVVAAAGGVLYVHYEKHLPCAEPVTYRIGEVDPRFGVSQAKLMQDAQAAAAVWNQAAGKTVLQFAADGVVPINLEYDTRQQTAQLGQSISNEQSQDAADRAKVDADEAAYQEALDAYNTEVQYWNARGGAPQSEYAKLDSERNALDAQSASLQEEVASYNAKVRSTNAKVDTYNSNADSDFEQGEYAVDGSGRRIDIYEFTDATSLERTLEHEFGHALGLGHVAGSDSIMYYQNIGKSTKLSSQDIAALDTLCHLK